MRTVLVRRGAGRRAGRILITGPPAAGDNSAFPRSSPAGLRNRHAGPALVAYGGGFEGIDPAPPEAPPRLGRDALQALRGRRGGEERPAPGRGSSRAWASSTARPRRLPLLPWSGRLVVRGLTSPAGL